MADEVKKEEFNIQPKAGLLGVFSRLNYKAWYAIGEFVDNSTASYFGHIPSMRFYRIKKMTVCIEYDSHENSLTVTDDAYGMDLADFKRAILMDQKPDNLNGRNEFGMGLKTAASWFGPVWSVESTRLGSTDKYFAKIDIPNLRENGLNTTIIETRKAPELEHGTKVKIYNLTKSINSPKTKSKIKDLLSSMYRRDIKDGEIEIVFNGDKLKFETIEPLVFRQNEWRKNIDFSFEFEGKKYHVTGFVGIMKNGSFKKAGFALFRYNRVVIGGTDQNYKPSEIFVQDQSQISLRLYGELDMNDFPVNQAKDGFVWDGGLEEAFINALKPEIQDYIDIAKISVSDRTKEEEINSSTSNKVKKNVESMFDGIVLDEVATTEPSAKQEGNPLDIVGQYKREQDEINSSSNDKRSETREYSIQLNSLKTEKFNVEWKISNNGKWIEYDEENKKISINLNHPFFKPYSAKDDFKEVLESFVVALICSQELAMMSSRQEHNDGKYILPSVFLNNMNNILDKIGKKRNVDD